MVVGEQAVQQLGFGIAFDRDGPAVGQPAVGREWRRGCGSTRAPGRTRRRAAIAGTVTATATAAPSKVVWDMGDGDIGDL